MNYYTIYLKDKDRLKRGEEDDSGGGWFGSNGEAGGGWLAVGLATAATQWWRLGVERRRRVFRNGEMGANRVYVLYI